MTSQFFPEQLFAAGFTDLVSVIPPGAQLTPTSTVQQSQVGKVPGMRAANGLWHGYGWRKHTPTAEEVHAWCLNGANVGLKADRYPAIDIDCTDEAISHIIRTVAEATLGKAPVRIGKAPKQLLLYQTAEPFGRMRLWFERDGTQHLVEVLGQGQQFLVHGTHPTTLQPYTWDRNILFEPVCVLTRDDADRFLTELETTLDFLSCGKITREGDGKPLATAAGDQAGLKAPSLDILRTAVRKIPNTDALFPARTDYLKMGYAIRAAGAEDEHDAYSIFAEWAAGWEGGNDPEIVRNDWRRMRGPYSVGWNWIAEQARVFGFDTSALDFDAVADRPDESVGAAPLYSDQWLAETVARRQRGLLRFVPQWDRYLAWTGGRWQPDAELLAEDIIKRELRAIGVDILRHGVTPKERKDSESLANSICSSGKVSAVSALVKSDRTIAVSVDALDHDPWTLNTPAGMVDLRTGVLRPHAADALCTKVVSVAPDFGGVIPRWLAFLDEATGGDTALVAYLQRLCGYCLTGSTIEQQLTFIFGSGGNGKGTFLNVLTGILGDYGRVAQMDTFTASHSDRHSTEIAMLAGARLVTASETQAGKRWDEAKVKSLTGGDLVSARFMRQDNFTFLPQFKLVFIGNHKPEIRDVDAAMRRRVQMVPFTVEPRHVDKNLGAALRAEWPAILAWMIAGCLAWQKEGLAPPQIVQDTTEAYFTDEDALGRWIKDRCALTPGVQTTTQDLYLSWREWANRNGEEVRSLKRLASGLIARKFERWRDPDTRRMGFLGLALQQPEGLEAIV